MYKTFYFKYGSSFIMLLNDFKILRFYLRESFRLQGQQQSIFGPNANKLSRILTLFQFE